MKKIFLAMILATSFLIVSCSNEPDIVTLDSGLKYLDDSLGTGREARNNDLITLHFKGWIIEDTSNLFGDWSADQLNSSNIIGDSKIKNQPVKFILGTSSFIKGSDAGIVGMKVGGRRTIIIPSKLAYGETGIGPIPPNSDLKLVAELIEVKDKIEVNMWDVDPLMFDSTESGLKYAIVKGGKGEPVEIGNLVTLHYSGYLEDSTRFDSSVERDEPFSFIIGMGQVIPGWDEGIQLMKKGGKARLVIPPDLAYGELDLEKIPANSTLIFDMEILDVQK